jgi:predicted RNase H-like HicB family nuclease
MQYKFTATFEQHIDYIDISFHDFEGLITYGETEEESMYMAEDALGAYLSALIELGKEIPTDSGIGNRSITVTI